MRNKKTIVSLFIILIMTITIYCIKNYNEKKYYVHLDKSQIKGVFSDIGEKIYDIADIDNNVSLQSKNLKFTFDNDFYLLDFKCIIHKEEESFKLYVENNKLYFPSTLYEKSLTQLDLGELLRIFDELDYNYLLDYLDEGDHYTFALYPEDSINSGGYIYNVNKYVNTKVFVYNDNTTSLINDKRYSSQKNTLLFTLLSMKESYKKEDNQGYYPLDKVYIIIPYE
ncbi:hypothetical protein HZI73_04680 [Vallitalea pronyensis]|uniref:Uncharacterized protein n=1 Tax=Vallitalea pronyensis TaxID=1348613 RepID=A0A8J8MHN9_9FIRM|nr:hypothetical protein [Vallitalea pronyensis]QUI21631.1 hypothetical protein HZI73_04680 [Vallitalea pronyensis]